MNHKDGTKSYLRDFRTDRRVILLSLLALPIGIVSALVARVLIWLIAVITNLSFFLRLSTAPVTPQESHLGYWVIIVPVIGALIIGFMARYGSEKIRGHGIPEALEAILLGRSLMEPKVAILKPISSAISIGTGGPFGAEGPIIMTGGAFGSIFAQLFHLTSAERKPYWWQAPRAAWRQYLPRPSRQCYWALNCCYSNGNREVLFRSPSRPSRRR